MPKASVDLDQPLGGGPNLQMQPILYILENQNAHPGDWGCALTNRVGAAPGGAGPGLGSGGPGGPEGARMPGAPGILWCRRVVDI